KLKTDEIKNIIDHLQLEYQQYDRPFFIQEVAKGFSFATKPEYAPWIKKLLNNEKAYSLSKASIETLAIIAYNQPITRLEIEKIRGVNCSNILYNLLKNDFIRIKGRKKIPGNPLIYNVTDKFLLHFGLKSLSDLPQIHEMGLREDESKITKIFSGDGN
ncbi:MAG: SMC-Scp complex subunit ScpB, partial [Candidatus Atribacteria bacterium]|nr:SMC-Scp complex subunit ScpB [Candidatus Atribacteria bacterium]